ncbi:MAG: hypothetical protein R6X14_03765 [bacterium]
MKPPVPNGKATVRRMILPVLGLFLFFGVYTFQRHMSLRLVWRQARQEAERRTVVEERDRVQAELQQMVGFSRLDSVWVSAGRPASTGGFRAHTTEVVRLPAAPVDLADSRR